MIKFNSNHHFLIDSSILFFRVQWCPILCEPSHVGELANCRASFLFENVFELHVLIIIVEEKVSKLVNLLFLDAIEKLGCSFIFHLVVVYGLLLFSPNGFSLFSLQTFFDAF